MSYGAVGASVVVPKITYRYVVKDVEYVGTRVTVSGGGDRTGEYAATIIRRYPVGARVTLWFDKEDPTYAVLDTSIPKHKFYVALFASAVMLAVTLGIARRQPKSAESKEPN